MKPVGVLFVCHANVCRSPLAEGVFRHMVDAAGRSADFRIDSAGTYAMEGAGPHPNSCAVASAHGIRLEGASRQLLRDDLERFDHILVMDRSNWRELERLAQPSAFGPLDGYPARIRLLLTVGDPDAREIDVRDPIGRTVEAYEATYRLLEGACRRLLEELTPTDS